MPGLAYTPQEVAVMSGAPLSMVQKAITAGRIPVRVDRRTRRRRLDGAALLAFALVQALPQELRVSPADAYRLLNQFNPASAGVTGELRIGDVVRVDAGKALAPARRRMRLYERTRDLIVSDPDIMGGSPTIRGTRITAQAILGRLDDGDTIATVLDDYPYLDEETVEAAALFAKANPHVAGRRESYGTTLLIDENLSPQLARHLRFTLGLDAVHVSEVGLAGASDTAVLAHAMTEHRIIITSNGQDFRKLGQRHPGHPGLAVVLSAVGRARQIALGEILATAIHAEIDRGVPSVGRLFEIDAAGIVRDYALP